MSKLTQLIEILLDRQARIDERDDAAIDLGSFDDESALQALVIVASDASESEIVLASCGESIGSIWQRRATWSQELLEKMTPTARREIKAITGRV
jgi:HEAT repeat protein